MRKLLLIAGLLVSALAFAGGPSLSNNGWKGIGGVSYGTLSIVKALKYCYSNGPTGTTLIINLGANSGADVANCGTTGGSVPSAGNLVVCGVESDSALNATTPIQDNFGDAGAWNTVGTLNGLTNSGYYQNVFWKQVGTPSGGNFAITVTQTNNWGILITCSEVHATSGSFYQEATSTLSGTSANCNAGSITTVSSSSYVFSPITMGAAQSAGAGGIYTVAFSNLRGGPDVSAQDGLTTVAGAQSPGWTNASTWCAARNISWNAH